ncbi:MAG TPA: alpha/beta fold hydrolase [Rhodocyclaceae bacterium]|nr:alpha/beta fold hydrolase [Rhodocyclaceae bacterium]
MILPSEIFLAGGACGVLLIHGLTGTPNEMRTVARGLHRAGFTVSATQLAGHCGDEKDLLATGWQDWFASVEAAADKLRGETDQIFVGGLSMGAVLSLKYAIEHPDKVSGLALYGTTFFYDGWSIPAIARLSFLLPILDRMGIGKKNSFVETFPFGIKNERVRRSISKRMLSGDSAAAGLAGNPWPSLAEFYRLSRNVQRNLARVRTPCLVMHAREDDVASLRNAHLIERRVSAPVETVVLDDSYHMITVDQQRDVVIEKSAGFFKKIATADLTASSSRLAVA